MTPLSFSARERVETLISALAVHGVPLREDSALCRAYIEGTVGPEHTAHTVAYTCALHRFLYEYTNYARMCSDVLPGMALRLTPHLGHRGAWKYVKEHEAPVLKASALQEAGGIPDVWPWAIGPPHAPVASQ